MIIMSKFKRNVGYRGLKLNRPLDTRFEYPQICNIKFHQMLITRAGSVQDLTFIAIKTEDSSIFQSLATFSIHQK